VELREEGIQDIMRELRRRISDMLEGVKGERRGKRKKRKDNGIRSVK